MSQKAYRYIIKENNEKEELLRIYQERIRNWKVKTLEEFQKESSLLLEEIKKEVKFVGRNWNTHWKEFLNLIKKELNAKFSQISDNFSPKPYERLPDVLPKWGLNNLSEILELKEEILKLRKKKIIDRERERRYEKIKKKFTEIGWILEVKVRERKVVVLRKEELVRLEISRKIERMKKFKR
jgi:hypothetical protein